jgi:hypothetical protein
MTCVTCHFPHTLRARRSEAEIAQPAQPSLLLPSPYIRRSAKGHSSSRVAENAPTVGRAQSESRIRAARMKRSPAQPQVFRLACARVSGLRLRLRLPASGCENVAAVSFSMLGAGCTSCWDTNVIEAAVERSCRGTLVPISRGGPIGRSTNEIIQTLFSKGYRSWNSA